MRTVTTFLLFSIVLSAFSQVDFSDKDQTPEVSVTDILMLEKNSGNYEYTTGAQFRGWIFDYTASLLRSDISDSLSVFVPDSARASSVADTATVAPLYLPLTGGVLSGGLTVPSGFVVDIDAGTNPNVFLGA